MMFVYDAVGFLPSNLITFLQDFRSMAHRAFVGITRAGLANTYPRCSKPQSEAISAIFKLKCCMRFFKSVPKNIKEAHPLKQVCFFSEIWLFPGIFGLVLGRKSEKRYKEVEGAYLDTSARAL